MSCVFFFFFFSARGMKYWLSITWKSRENQHLKYQPCCKALMEHLWLFRFRILIPSQFCHLIWLLFLVLFLMFNSSSLNCLILSGQTWQLWTCWINRSPEAICCSYTSLLSPGTNWGWCYSCWVLTPQRVQCIGQKRFSHRSAFLNFKLDFVGYKL